MSTVSLLPRPRSVLQAGNVVTLSKSAKGKLSNSSIATCTPSCNTRTSGPDWRASLCPPKGTFLVSDETLVIQASRRLEAVLKEHHGAQGRGLHALVTCVEHRLPAKTVKQLRWIATLRNKVVHEEGYRLENARDYARQARRLERELGGRRALSRRDVVTALFLVVLVMTQRFLLSSSG